MMASAPDKSIPKQAERWSDVKGAYRLLNNPAVQPEAIQGPHRALVRAMCREHKLVLSIQDTTQLDFTNRAVTDLGEIGNGRQQGLLQHSALAATEDGRVLGVLDQQWSTRDPKAEGETRRQRQGRRTEADVWAETAGAIGPMEGVKLLHVGDRHSDVFSFMHEALRLKHGFVLRAKHDRYIDDRTDRLWSKLHATPAVETIGVFIETQQGVTGRGKQRRETVRLEIAYAPVRVPPPTNDPRFTKAEPLTLWAVHVREANPPEGFEPIDWMLLTTEPVTDAASARRVIGIYQCRWVIEEWHRALKEGCRLEASQLKSAQAIRRLAAVTSVVAVRLLQLRDLADDPTPAAEDPRVLEREADPLWIQVVAALADTDPRKLSPRGFFRAIARRGGWLARKHDGRPGWKTIWRGWSDVQIMVEGIRLHQTRSMRRSCG